MITVNEVSKSFGSTPVLQDLSFSIRPGLMTGFVGGNGAGKTTTMRILLGVLDADSGRIEVDGAPITRDYRAGIGYMPEERGLYPKMSVLDQLVYLGRLHHMRGADAKARALELLERLNLGDRAGSRLEELSLGNQQRAQIAAALVHDPVALVLDEPFSGLDPNAVETTLQVLRETADTGVPVLFSSHQLDLVERLCDELIILAGGRVRASGTRDELLAAHERWSLVANLPYNVATPLVLDLLRDVPRIGSMLVMVQREVGERLAAGARERAVGIPSMLVAYHGVAEVVGRVPATVFHPQPKVESVLVRIERHAEPPVSLPLAEIEPVLRAAYGQRRKMLRRSLADLVDPDGFVAADVDPTARPETCGSTPARRSWTRSPRASRSRPSTTSAAPARWRCWGPTRAPTSARSRLRTNTRA